MQRARLHVSLRQDRGELRFHPDQQSASASPARRGSLSRVGERCMRSTSLRGAFASRVEHLHGNPRSSSSRCRARGVCRECVRLRAATSARCAHARRTHAHGRSSSKQRSMRRSRRPRHERCETPAAEVAHERSTRAGQSRHHRGRAQRSGGGRAARTERRARRRGRRQGRVPAREDVRLCNFLQGSATSISFGIDADVRRLGAPVHALRVVTPGLRTCGSPLQKV